MAIDIQNFDGQKHAPDSAYPNGDIKDETGYNANDGTGMNRKAFADIFQFFSKLMTEASIVYNNLPDNEYTGNQNFQAFKELTFGISYIFDRSSSEVIKNTVSFIEIPAGAPNLGELQFPNGDTEVKYHRRIVIKNNSSNACNIFPNSIGSDTVNGTTSYSIVAGKFVEFYYDASATKNWIVLHNI